MKRSKTIASLKKTVETKITHLSHTGSYYSVYPGSICNNGDVQAAYQNGANLVVVSNAIEKDQTLLREFESIEHSWEIE